MIKIFFLTLFLSSSVYTSAHTGGLAGGGKNKCSKTFKSSNQETAEKGGIIKRLSRLFTKEPPPTILDELNDPNLKIQVHLMARPNIGYRHYGDQPRMDSNVFNKNLINSIGFLYIYQSAKNKKEKGRFYLVFTTRVQIKDPPRGIDGRIHLFRQIIFWESDAKNAHLDKDTIKQIFEQLYEGNPEKVAQEVYNKVAVFPEEYQAREFLTPRFLFENNRDRVREAIIHAI